MFTSPPPTDNGLDSRVALCSYLIIYLNIVFFTSLNITDRWLYDALNREDNWTENLTALWFFLAGLLLVVTACRERSLPLRRVYMLAAAAFLFAAGEEISWGQRLFGWTTPDFLMGLNMQGETNIHNIHSRAFGKLQAAGATLLCTVTAIALCYRQDRLFGIPLPSMPLLFGFLLLRLYAKSLYEQFYATLITVEQGLLLLLAVFALASRQPKCFILVASTLALNLALWYAYGPQDLAPYAKPYEVYEYLLGLACLCYALQLLLAQRRQAAVAQPQGAAGKMARAHVPLWLAACALVMVGSVGLAILKYVQNRDEQKTWKLLASGESAPLARSHFDFHIVGNRLVYLRKPCIPTDTYRALRMSVRIVPVDSDDLPSHRKRLGHDDRYYRFYRQATFLDEGCLSSVPLPDYPIARIRVRQAMLDENGEWQTLSEITFPHPDEAVRQTRRLENALRSVHSSRPVVRDAFDVHFDSSEGRLVYVRKPCADADVAARFFSASLPGGQGLSSRPPQDI